MPQASQMHCPQYFLCPPLLREVWPAKPAITTVSVTCWTKFDLSQLKRKGWFDLYNSSKQNDFCNNMFIPCASLCHHHIEMCNLLKMMKPKTSIIYRFFYQVALGPNFPNLLPLIWHLQSSPAPHTETAAAHAQPRGRPRDLWAAAWACWAAGHAPGAVPWNLWAARCATWTSKCGGFQLSIMFHQSYPSFSIIFQFHIFSHHFFHVIFHQVTHWPWPQPMPLADVWRPSTADVLRPSEWSTAAGPLPPARWWTPRRLWKDPGGFRGWKDV